MTGFEKKNLLINFLLIFYQHYKNDYYFAPKFCFYNKFIFKNLGLQIVNEITKKWLKNVINFNVTIK